MLTISLKTFADVQLINYTELSEPQALAVLTLRNHPDVRRWMTHQTEISHAEHLAFINTLNSAVDKTYFVVEQGGQIVGTINFTGINQDEVSCGLLANPFLDRQGKGRLLLEAIKHYTVQQLGLKSLVLSVQSHNERALTLYKKAGFAPYGTCHLNHTEYTLMKHSNLEPNS
jgi:UDP-4-amino-4,6-dideoxy-N-acetyl-beta-L-altrosamine N-acetyltransferase